MDSGNRSRQVPQISWPVDHDTRGTTEANQMVAYNRCREPVADRKCEKEQLVYFEFTNECLELLLTVTEGDSTGKVAETDGLFVTHLYGLSLYLKLFSLQSQLGYN